MNSPLTESTDKTAGNLPLPEILEFALATIRATRPIFIEKYNSRDFAVELKEDASFVTDIDRLLEREIRGKIEAAFPAHGILGEEYPHYLPDAEIQWVIDPIDGTANFKAGIPTCGSMLGICHKGVPVAGIIDHPILGLEYYGARGLGVYKNGKRISLSDTKDASMIAAEITGTGSRDDFARAGSPEVFDKLHRACSNMRVYCDCFALTQALEGGLGGFVCYGLKTWDAAAAMAMTIEAGGALAIIRDFQGWNPKSTADIIFGKPSVVSCLRTIIEKQ